MAGFKASEAIEELTYDFAPYAEVSGSIPEPSSDQIEKYRAEVFGTIKTLGLTPEEISTQQITVDKVFDLMDKTGEVEENLLAATAELTQIDLDVLRGLPYRIKAAFSAYIMGTFFDPEA